MTKKIHQIWLGNSPIPAEFHAWSDTWKAHHPNWEHRLWLDEDAQQFPLYRKLAPLCVGNTAKADLLRLLILAKYGGIYADMDTECLANFTPILFGERFVLGACADHWDSPGNGWNLSSHNGWIYAEIECPQMKAVIRNIERSTFFIIIALTFSGPWLEAVADKAGGVTLLPYFVLSPMAPWEPVPDPIPVGCLSIHHYEGSWLGDAQREKLKLPPRKTPQTVEFS